MIHILKNVYLNYRCNTTLRNDAIYIVDEEIDDIFFDPEVAKMLEGNTSKLLYRAKNVEELLSNFENDNQFFNKLLKFKSSNHRDELMIFCDKDSFKVFFAKWLKTLMPNADYQTFRTIFLTYKNHELYVTRHLNQLNELRLKTCDYWPSSEEEIENLFKLDSFNLTKEEYKKHVSIEFQLATFVENNSCSIASDLAEKLHKLAERRIILDMFYTKTEMEYYLYDLDLLWPELDYQDYGSIDVAAMIAKKPSLAVLGDMLFRETKSINALAQKYNVKDLADTCKEFAIYTQGLGDIVCLNQFIENNYVTPLIMDVLDTDLRYKGTYRSPPYMGQWIDLKRMNGHLLSYIADLYTEGNYKQLKKLSLDKDVSDSKS